MKNTKPEDPKTKKIGDLTEEELKAFKDECYSHEECEDCKYHYLRCRTDNEQCPLHSYMYHKSALKKYADIEVPMMRKE